MTYSIEKVATLIGARRIGTSEHVVRWLLIDSRSLCFAEETLFFALRTGRGDGHKYIEQLYGRGVRAFVVDQAPASPHSDAVYLVVPSALAALQRLAERHRDEFSHIPVVGITGSNGKTMVKEWIYQLLIMSSLPGRQVTRSPRSYNSQIGVPLSVWLMNEQTRVAIFEAGISEPGEMGRLHDIIQPTIGVLTSLGAAHQENFRSLEEKCMEKLRLMADTKVVVYCSDDDTVSRCLRSMGYQGKRLGWSHFDQKAPMFIEKVEHNLQSVTVHYVWQGEQASYELPFIDEASVSNSITSAVVVLHLGLTPSDLSTAMPKLEPVAMRMEVKEGQRGCTLINDSYNNDINSLDLALDFMQRRTTEATLPSLLSGKTDGAAITAEAPAHNFSSPGDGGTLILSDICQSGEKPERLYREVAQLITNRGVKKFIGIGPQLSAMADVFPTGEHYFFPTTEAFLQSSVMQGLSSEIVLLKGARQFGFERISEQLEQKVHETILEVSLGAVVNNLNYYRSLLSPDTKLVCMVKADAYGAGAIEISKTLQEHHVDYLAVAVADEGVALRRAGITTNIMVMNPEMTAFKTMFDYDLEPEVYSFRLLDALIHAARKEGITGWPVHIKLDTGMHRLGFNMNEMDTLIDRLREQQAVIPRSVFSHFVGSDSPDFDKFSAMQFQWFDKASQKLQSAFSHKILRHIDNSAGIVHFPERQLDMCRLGIGLYGVNPLSEELRATLHSSLKCVSTLKTTILQLRHIPAGDSVGYSRRTVMEHDSVIAAIPIGYADGLNRHLGNRCGYCLVNGQRAPYVGNICMDVAMIDVTDIDCHEGDTVEIFGTSLPVTAISNLLDTIPYELLTAVSNRVKRVYFQD
jgi:alanine racemase